MGFKINKGPELYAPVNESMKNVGAFKIIWQDEQMTVGDWEKESVHSERLPQRIPGREGTYEVRYFRWKPDDKQERMF